MAATTNPHSSPTASGDELHALAVQLYGLSGSVRGTCGQPARYRLPQDPAYPAQQAVPVQAEFSMVFMIAPVFVNEDR